MPCVSSSALLADDAKSSYSITSEFTYASEYIFRGIEQQDHAIQPALTFTRDSLTLGLWTSQALNHRSQSWSEGNEVDLTIGYGVNLAPDVTLTVGGTYYYYASARPSRGEPDDTYEPSLAITGPLGPLNGSATYYHDFVLRSDTLLVSAARGFPLPGERGAVDKALAPSPISPSKKGDDNKATSA